MKSKRFDPAFKKDIAQLCVSGNRSCASLADELGFHQNTVYKWVQQYNENPEQAFPGACKIFCVKSKSWYNHFIQNGGLQNGKKETQPCKCSRYRPYF